MRPLLVAAALVLSAPALADDAGIPLTVRVLDAAGDPVLGAAVRSPVEEERHRVNSVTGSWTATALYPPDGDPLYFEKGLDLTFEISAPGYLSETVHYVMRRRRNTLDIQLVPMQLKGDLEKIEDPIIAFGRDTPIGGVPVEDEGD